MWGGVGWDGVGRGADLCGCGVGFCVAAQLCCNHFGSSLIEAQRMDIAQKRCRRQEEGRHEDGSRATAIVLGAVVKAKVLVKAIAGIRSP